MRKGLLHHLVKTCWIGLLTLLFSIPCSGQWYMEVNGPSQISPCDRYPIDITLINDDGESTNPSTLTLTIDSNLTIDLSTLTGAVVRNANDPYSIELNIPPIEPCESHRIQVFLDPDCASVDRLDAVHVSWSPNVNTEVQSELDVNIFALSLRLSNIEIYYDSSAQSFRKSYVVINDGKVALSNFKIYVDGEDNMDILTTNNGQLSANGDTLFFSSGDFLGIGNFNDFLEPGEVMQIIQDINLNACQESFPFSHILETPCGDKICRSQINNASDLEVTIGEPRVWVRSIGGEKTGFCDTGEICLIVTAQSFNGSFPQANAAYNIKLNPGWSSIQGGQRTNPQRDNCLSFIEGTINGQRITFQTAGFSGWGIDFTRLTSDPDGPGGLSDIDGDGRYDDLHHMDTVKIVIKYLLRQSCLNIGCNNRVLSSRILRVQSEHTNYCNDDYSSDIYLSQHQYYWNEGGASVLNLDAVYAKGDKDTIDVRISKSIGGFLDDCPDDSMVIRIDFPRVVDLPPGAIITVNGDTVNYTFNGRRLTVHTDSIRAWVRIPIELDCETSGGGGGVQTACTFCLGSGLATYRFRVEADYFCGNGCTPRIPLICLNSGQFYSLCDPDAKGIVSEGKMVVDSLILERQSLGYTDSTKSTIVEPKTDSLGLADLLTYDTFLLKAPISINCDANYRNVRLSLLQASSIRFMGNQRDTIKYFEFLSDTIKYYDAESDTWYTCVNPLGAEYFNTANNGFRNNYIKEVNVSNLPCLNENYSIPDSMILIVRGRVLNEVTNNAQNLGIRTYLQYNQDGCNLDDLDQIRINVYSGLPNGGYVTWSQPYQRDTTFRGTYNILSVCGEFQLTSTIDNYYFNIENKDPFPNEYREPYLVNSIEFQIPDFFDIDSSSFNFIEDFYRSSTRIVESDTSKIPYSVNKVDDHWIVTFPGQPFQDFSVLRKNYRINLRPDCYGNFQDTIKVIKRLTVQNQRNSPTRRDTTITQFMLFNVVSPLPRVDASKQQFLYQDQSITEIDVLVPTASLQPEKYFKFPAAWCLIESLNGFTRMDSLIDCTDSVEVKFTPEVLGPNRWLIRYDSLFKSRKYKLHSTVDQCQRDSIRITIGSRCSTFPSSFDTVPPVCEEYLDQQIVRILPEVPQLTGQFTIWPDSVQPEPCDTFYYEAEVRNANLGHLLNPVLQIDSITGMDILTIELEYPEGQWNDLGIPQLNGTQWTWSLDSLFGAMGLEGFAQPDLNHFSVRLALIGNCEIQDGSVVNLSLNGLTLCGDFTETNKISAPPLLFEKDSTVQQSDIYDLDLHFYGDTACGDFFTLRATWTSMDNASETDGQRFGLAFDKELSFVPGSLQGLRNAPNQIVDFQRLDGQEKFWFDLPNGIVVGDSIVIEAVFERTCTGICKATSFGFDLLAPSQIGCSTDPSGACSILKENQSWTFDDIVVSPYYQLDAIDGWIERNGSGEDLVGRFRVTNLSDFSMPDWIFIDYYDDVNGDGQLDGGDVWLGVDSVFSQFGPGIQEVEHETRMNWPLDASCQAIAVIGNERNTCLCEGDTLIFPTLRLIPLSKDTTICFDDEVVIGFDAIAGYSYMWNNRSELGALNTSMTDYRPDFNIQGGENYTDTLLLEATRRMGCSAMDTFVVHLYRPLVDAVQQDSIRCHGDSTASARAMLTLGIGSSQFEWTPGGSGSRLLNAPAGTYLVRGTDSLGCWDTTSITVVEPDPLQEDLSATSDYNGYGVRCEGESSGWVEVDIMGGSPDYTITWNGRSTMTNRIDSLSQGWTSFVITDRYGCEVEDSVFLESPPGMEITSESTLAGCDEEHGAEIQVTPTAGIGPFNYEWEDGESGAERDGLLAGQYIVTITDANGCEAYDTIDVEQTTFPILSVNIQDSLIQYGETIRLFAQSNANPGTYIWYPSEEVSCDTCKWTEVTPTDELIVQVKVIDENGCEAWAEIRLRVQITKRVWAPNAFTPDGNNINDGFTLFGNPTLERIEYLAIFDRWGEQVFNTEDIPPGDTAFGWDGILNGTDMNPAVFAWIARVRFVDGEKRWLSGDVTLIR